MHLSFFSSSITNIISSAAYRPKRFSGRAGPHPSLGWTASFRTWKSKLFCNVCSGACSYICCLVIWDEFWNCRDEDMNVSFAQHDNIYKTITKLQEFQILCFLNAFGYMTSFNQALFKPCIHSSANVKC